MSKLFPTEEMFCSCGEVWQGPSSWGASCSDKALIGTQAIFSLLFRDLCLQGAAVTEPPSTPEASHLCLRGAAETSCLSVPSILPCISASPLLPPFCSWPSGASIWPPSVLLHPEPAERLLLQPGAGPDAGHGAHLHADGVAARRILPVPAAPGGGQEVRLADAARGLRQKSGAAAGSGGRQEFPAGERVRASGFPRHGHVGANIHR